MTSSPDRNKFLSACLKELDARGVLFCISRNHDKFWVNGSSDVDILVSPAQFQAAIRCFENAADASGYRIALRNYFVNYSLVFHADHAGLVRIDIEIDVRWKTRTLLDAETILAARREEDGLPIPSPEHEALVLLCNCAWLGKITPTYKQRLEELTASDERAKLTDLFLCNRFGFDRSSFLRLLATGDVMQLRTCFQNGSTPQNRIRNICRKIARTARRLIFPPGIIINCHRVPREDFLLDNGELEFLFPSAKAARTGDPNSRIFLALFQGGIFWQDSKQLCFSGAAVRLWAGSTRYFRAENGRIHHDATNQSAPLPEGGDFIGRVLADINEKPSVAGRSQNHRSSMPGDGMTSSSKTIR